MSFAWFGGAAEAAQSADSGSSVALTGVSSTAEVGTQTANRSIALTGSAATTAVGSVGPSQQISGNSVSASVGTVIPDRQTGVSGIAATASVGSVGIGSSVALSGAQITGSVGSITIGSDLNIALSGVSASGAVGTVTVAGQQAEQVTSGGGRYRHYSINDDLEPEQKKQPKVKTKPQNVVVDQLVSKPSRWEKPNELINQAIIQYNQQVMEGDQADSIARGLMDEEEAICLLLLVA